MSVSIFTDDGATVEDAEACIAQYQQLKKNAAFCANLQEMLAAYFLYMMMYGKRWEFMMRLL